jgi:hypothetical protein
MPSWVTYLDVAQMTVYGAPCARSPPRFTAALKVRQPARVLRLFRK